jgi:hypothetical protein
LATVITWLALAGALASFIAGAAISARSVDGGPARWLAVLVWPLAIARFARAHAQAARLSKALVAFIACLMIAAAAWSAAANLHRFAR